MTGNRSVAYVEPHRVEVRDIDFPTFEPGIGYRFDPK